MRHKVAGYKLGRNTSHRRSLLRNLVTSVIVEERIETTVPKAKAAREATLPPGARPPLT
jgi:large subunit ribosomal protein L17